MSKVRPARPGRVRRAAGQALAVTAATVTLSLIASTADASAAVARPSASDPSGAPGSGRAAVARAALEVKWDRWPDWSIWTNLAKPDANNWNAWTPSSAVSEQSRADVCRVGHVLHRGGPLVKKLSVSALAGTDADRRATLLENSAGKTPIDLANDKDWATAPPGPGFETEQQQRWLAQINKIDHHADVPEFDTATRKFRRASHDRTSEATFVDLVPRAGKKSLAGVTAIIGQTKDSDEYLKALGQFQKELAASWGSQPVKMEDIALGMSADDARMVLQSGGFPKVAPVPDSVEFRTEVEAMKIRWSNCDPENPADPYRVLDGVVNAARTEWKAELDGQATQRNSIVAAEAQAYDDMWNASYAMVEAIGQAWVAEEVLAWQRKQGPNWKPTPAEQAKIDTELKNTQTRITAQIAAAKKYAESAKAQSGKVDTAQTEAAKLAASAGVPRGRGLAYAQQSAQVTKASAAGAAAAYKAANTALQASKATVADSGALFSRARAEANALEAEYRRAAAQESAAQATAAAKDAAAQATEAGEAATRAKSARTKSEKAEALAKTAAAETRAKLETAKAEGAKAAAARKRADDERAKAAEAEARAKTEQAAAAAALQRANTAGATADTKSGAALDAERRAAAARDEAVAAEQREDAAASRAAAFEATAAATQGTENAGAARAAATQARTAANDAAGAAGRARTAADSAGTAAVAARKAATEATGAASRSRAASDGAQTTAARTHAQATVAHAAAADAIDASRQAAENVRAAEAFARVAAANALKAKADAAAAKSQAGQARVESARTAGYAYAASRSATAAGNAAAAVINPANEAISLGSPYKEIDASAGMAVLIGQSAKTLAEQQAQAAQAKADEAAREATAAKDAAARANADTKLAAQAAATAAEQAAKAAKSVSQAQLSAAAAATDAAAASKAAANATKYDAQAKADATAADGAATTAEGEAAAARNAATEAEKDAAGARAAANAATVTADKAATVASAAERAAVVAEAAAANAQKSATEADQAATRAEEALRERIKAQRAARVDAGSPATEPDLTSDEEAILLKTCGQTCVDQWRAAKAATAQDVLDWVKANGGEILLDTIGYTDAKKCFSEGDVEGCLWTLVNAISIATIALKLPAISVAIARVAMGITKFFEASAKGKRVLKELRSLIEKVKKEPNTPPCKKKPVARTVHRAISLAGSTGGGSHAASGLDDEVCDLDIDKDVDSLDYEVLQDIDERYGPDIADGVEYNWEKMRLKNAEGKPTKEALDHVVDGAGLNPEEMAKYFTKWRGKETHIDPRTGNRTVWDEDKGFVIVINARFIHGYKMTEDVFNGKYKKIANTN